MPVQLNNTSQLCYFISKKPLSENEKQEIIYSKSVPVRLHNQLQAFSRKAIDNLVDQKQVNLINLDGLFCDGSVCSMGKASEPYYYDKDHLTPSGAFLTSAAFINAINE